MGSNPMRHGPTGTIMAALVAVSVTACQQPTAESIIAEVGDAMAGSEGIDGITTMRVRTTYPDHDYPVISELRRPNLLRTEGVDNYVLVFDGSQAAFLVQPPGEDGTRPEPGLVPTAYVRDMELDIAWVFPAFFEQPTEYLGVEIVDGVETYVLTLTLPLGIPVTYYVDTETHLPYKARADVTIDGNQYHPERVFRDYVEEGGFTYARSFAYSWMPEDVNTATVEQVEVNVPLDDSRFRIPAEIVTVMSVGTDEEQQR